LKLKNYVDPIFTKEFHEIKNKTLEDVIAYFQAKKCPRLYVVERNRPLYVFTPAEIVDIFMQNKKDQKIEDYIKENKKDIFTLKSDLHIIDAYNDMRKKRVEFAPVEENGEIIGEVSFDTLGLKIGLIAVKDPVTDVYNQKYFQVMLDEYNELEKPIGIIMIKLENISLLESLYGHDFKVKALKKFAEVIKKSVRDVDFIFRVDDKFIILTFTDFEILLKIVSRIKEALKDVEVDDFKIPYKIAYSHVPEMENNILIALDNCERKLIERD